MPEIITLSAEPRAARRQGRRPGDAARGARSRRSSMATTRSRC